MLSPEKLRYYRLRKHFLACLFLVITIVLPFSLGIVGPYRLVGHDMLNQYIPWKSFLVSELRSGRFPLWDPHSFSGYPIFSNPQIALYYPLDLITLWTSLDRYPAVFYALHLSLSAVAMYFWVYRHTRVSRAGVVSGLGWAWSGYISRNIMYGFTGLVSASLYIPLGMILIENWFSTRKPRALGLLALIMALQIFAGHPQPVVYTSYFFTLYAIVLAVHHYRRGSDDRRYAVLAALCVPLALAFAALMTAVQNLPFAEVVKMSAIRGDGVTLEYASFDSVPIAFLPTFLAPFFFGNPLDQTFWITTTGYQEICGYPGMLIWILAIFGWRYRSPVRIFLIGIAFVTLVTALGTKGPLFPLFYHVIPGFKWFRDPGRILILFNFCLAALAGFGVADLLRSSRPRLSYHFRIGVGAILALQLVALIWLWPMQSHALRALESHMAKSQPESQGDLKNLPVQQQMQLKEICIERLVTMRQSAFESLGWTLAGLLLIVGIRFGLSPAIVALMGLVLLGGDLGRFHFNLLRYMRAEEYRSYAYPQSPVVEFLQRDQSNYRVMIADDAISWLTRKYHPELIPERMTVRGIQTVRGYNPTILKHYAQYINTMQGWPPDKWVGGLLFLQNPLKMNRKQLDQLNVKYLLTYGPLSGDFKLAFNDRGLRIYENQRALPRAYILHDEQVAAEKVEIIEYSPNRVRLSVQLDSPGTLVLSDTYYKGWQATTNGRPLDITIHDRIFRAVSLDAGDHEVEFFFRPASFYLGLVVSLLSWLFCLIFLLGFGKRKGLGKNRSPQRPDFDNG